MTPIVSIVTPTYNRAHLLPRVWASLSAQTEQRFQWVVVDDGSTDKTLDIIKGFNDPRIVYVWQENRGVNFARNRGEKEITAEFVVYLDSDDEFLSENSLRDMVFEIQSTSPEVAWVSFAVVDGNGGRSLCHIPSERLQASYVDVVCEKKIWGEFFSIYRRDAISISPWPPFNGLESLKLWRIVKHRPALYVNRPERIYHRDAGENLSGGRSLISRSEQMAAATMQLILEHQDAWREHCPCQIGKYRFYRALYISLYSYGLLSISDLIQAVRYGGYDIKKKSIYLAVGVFFPIKLRKWIFLKRSI